jgi:hypothetical protein
MMFKEFQQRVRQAPSSKTELLMHFTRSGAMPMMVFAACWIQPAFAVWEYSLDAQVGMYDGLASVCETFAPSEAAAAKAEFERRLPPDERSGLDQARATAEYREVREGARKEALDRLRASAGNERQECKVMFRQ